MHLKTLLAIESSCDETALSVVQARGEHAPSSFALEPVQTSWQPLQQVRVLAHLVESQTASHQPFGGVVPEVAARDHLAIIHPLALRALAQSGLQASELDGIVVTLGPGLIGALMVGVLFARGLATALDRPLWGVNHVDAHLAPTFLLPDFLPTKHLGQWFLIPHTPFPALALTVSGGHCHLSRIATPHERVVLGRTADDACGEAFDKVAKLLGCDYPGGPEIERMAARCTESPFRFPATLADKTNRLGFSFSGLKTQVLETVRKLTGNPLGKISGADLSPEVKCQLAWSFQEAALGQLVDRLKNAILDEVQKPQMILVAGGVAANARFRRLLSELGIEVRVAPLSLCSDNATMIGLQGLLQTVNGFQCQPFARYEQFAKH